MSDNLVNREFFMGVVSYHTPALCGYMERTIPRTETVTIEQLVSLLKDELTKINTCTPESLNGYLCETQPLAYWLDNVGKHVLPVIANHMSLAY